MPYLNRSGGDYPGSGHSGPDDPGRVEGRTELRVDGRGEGREGPVSGPTTERVTRESVKVRKRIR